MIDQTDPTPYDDVITAIWRDVEAMNLTDDERHIAAERFDELARFATGDKGALMAVPVGAIRGFASRRQYARLPEPVRVALLSRWIARDLVRPITANYRKVRG